MKILSRSRLHQSLGAIAIVLLFYQNGASEILNAYEHDLDLLSISIKNIEALISSQKTPSGAEQKLIKTLKDLKTKKAEIQTYYLKTATALVNLKAIDPILFDSINRIKDKKGNITHVYVKVVPEEAYLVPDDPRSTMAGYSIVAPSNEDGDICSTKYGTYTAYVEIKDIPHKSFCYSNVFLLAHEFGHLIYEIPNLAEYSRFYRATYNRASQLAGHHWNDPSGKTVEKTIKSFLRLYKDYRHELGSQEQAIIAKSH